MDRLRIAQFLGLCILAAGIAQAIWTAVNLVPELTLVILPLGTSSIVALLSIYLKQVYDGHREDQSFAAAKEAVFWEFKRNFAVLCKKAVSLTSTASWDIANRAQVWKRLKRTQLSSVLKAYIELYFFNYQIQMAGRTFSGLKNEASAAKRASTTGESWKRRKQRISRNRLMRAMWKAWPKESMMIDWERVKEDTWEEIPEFCIEPADAFKRKEDSS